ncbi:hypothetical protein ACJDT4_14230 [Clostridium neuense]|uniref:Fimbrial protein n=1 Tax=Clostridium neuense TaxID=1728934 RepID=A0ABW8THC7_9CLOT
MEKNNFLPYEIRKKRESLRNKLANSTIIILFFINFVCLMNLYFKLLDCRSKAAEKQETSITVQNKEDNIKADFKDVDILKLISEKIKNKDYTSISIKEGTVEVDFSSKEDLKESIRKIEEDSRLIITSLSKAQGNDGYSMIIEVKGI